MTRLRCPAPTQTTPECKGYRGWSYTTEITVDDQFVPPC